ncbi:reverse transcriptase domain-containing protein [Tanacetum coccineum]
MTAVSRHIAEHRLNIREGCLPIGQKKRGQAPERNKAIQEEVEKLVDAEIMKEVHYHSWLSNPVMEGMFLGYKVNTNGLKVCPDKTNAVLSLPSLGCLKDVQKLNGKLASLNRFLSKSAKKSLPFFKTLKKCTKKSNFQWTQEAEVAFRQMKKLIAELPMLTAPKEMEELIIYLAVAKEAISAVLMIERGGQANASEIWKEWGGPRRSQVERGGGECEVTRSDALRKIASTCFAHLSKQVLVEELNEKSINEKEVLAIVEEERHTWMTPICEYLTKEILPKDKNKARAVRRIGISYQCSLNDRKGGQANASVLCEPRPTRAVDQLHPYGKTGVSLAQRKQAAEKILPGTYNCCNHRSAIDYFTKWIEAKLVATITGNQVKKFAWDNIICRFGLPREIVLDNRKQFRDNPFKDWCEKLYIRQCFASVKHPQTNDLVKRENRSLGERIKARLDERSKDWI